MSFSSKIITWYDEHRRVLPWRDIRDPYRIWLSEVILQQTRIEQGRAYYERFCEAFPTVQELAAADEEQVLKLWQGLGYYSRARNLHSAARYIVKELDGCFPTTYDGIRALKGVGKYTAAAIASFAYCLPYPVIDGNVYRLISRVYGIYTPIGTDAAYKEFETLLCRLMDREHPDVFNQAMMDFGSIYCKPVGCDCTHCIFCNECVAHAKDKVSVLPVKAAARPVQHRYFYYLDMRWRLGTEEYTVLHRRTEGDIWKGLYEFPLIETAEALPAEDYPRQVTGYVQQLFGTEPQQVIDVAQVTHKLTHRTIHATFLRVLLVGPVVRVADNMVVVKSTEVEQYPVSRLMEMYVKGQVKGL